MSEIRDFADFVGPKLDNIDTNVVNALNSLGAVTGDVQFLKDEIAKLSTPISLEDKARLDAIRNRVGALDGNVASLASSLKTLDDATPTV